MNRQARLEQVVREAIEPYLIRAVLSGFETAILKALAREGVVIKGERELPVNPYLSRGLMKSYQYTGFERAQQDMLKAGYVAVEPLIEGSK